MRGQVNKTLFIKRSNNELFLVQLYVDDIIFCAIIKALCKEFSSSMQNEFEMSIMGELTFFLGLQVKQLNHGTFLCQTKYCAELIKKFSMEKCKETSTPKTKPPIAYNLRVLPINILRILVKELKEKNIIKEYKEKVIH